MNTIVELVYYHETTWYPAGFECWEYTAEISKPTGLYDYRPGGSTPCESPEVAAIVETLRGKGTRTYLPLGPYVSEGWSTIKGEFTVSGQ